MPMKDHHSPLESQQSGSTPINIYNSTDSSQ